MSANTKANVTDAKNDATPSLPEVHGYYQARDGVNGAVGGKVAAQFGKIAFVVERSKVDATIAAMNDDRTKGMVAAKAHGQYVFLLGEMYSDDRGANLGAGTVLQCRDVDAVTLGPTGEISIFPAEMVDVYICRPEGRGETSKADPRKGIANGQKVRIVNAAKKWEAAFDGDAYAATVDDLLDEHDDTEAFKTAIRAHVDGLIDAIRPATEKKTASPQRRILTTTIGASPLAALMVRVSTDAEKADARKTAKALA